jgi:hypothetical protein
MPLTASSRTALGLITCLIACQAAAQASDIAGESADTVQSQDGLIMLDYQVLKVPGEAPIDLLGFHLAHRVSERLYLGVGAYAPHIKGQYGGFMTMDVGAHFRQHLSGPWSLTADLAGGGGGGGRSIAQSRLLSGTGGYTRAAVGLAYDMGPLTVGAGVSRMKFRKSLIDSTQANVFVTVPYSYLNGAYQRHGEPLSTVELQRTAGEAGENLLTLSLDNLRQLDPQGTNKSTIRTADLQYSHFFSPDSYWFGAVGVGYAGLPIYNQVLGGVGRRVRLSPDLNLYAQLGMGSGGYAPETIDTGPGLLIYPKVALEYMLGRDLGLALSVGYLSAPKGSSRNQTYALALTHHLGSVRGGADTGSLKPRWSGFRVSTFQQTEFNVRYRGLDKSPLRMVGVQVDKALNDTWYLPFQTAVAYNDYLGYPGYGEVLAGLGVQTTAGPGDQLQFFGQLMGGANVHGKGGKLSAGVRYMFNDRLSMHLAAGQTVTQGSGDRRFSASSLAVGIDYRFAVPAR